MSTVAGIVDLRGGTVAAGELERLAAGNRTLGPDRTTGWTGPGAAFVQLETFLRPQARADRLLVENDALVTLFAGRIDGRDELAAALGLAAGAAAGIGDGRLFHMAADRFGDRIGAHLLGDYAFVIYQKARHRTLVGTDIAAAKSVYFTRCGGQIAFSGTISALLALDGVERRLDRTRLLDLLSFFHQDIARTAFDGISRLAPGHIMTIEDGEVRTAPYWRPGEAAAVRFARDADYVDALAERFGKAVADRMRPGEQVGMFCSGGLDSASVAAFAALVAARRGTRLPTFTSRPAEGMREPYGASSFTDEGPHVLRLAEHLPILDPYFVTTAGESAGSGLERWFAAFDGPVPTPQNITWIDAILAGARKQGIRVMLGGFGGNYTLTYRGAGLPAELLRERDLRAIAADIWGYARERRRSVPAIAVSEYFLHLLPRRRSRWRGQAYVNKPLHASFDAPVYRAMRRAQLGLGPPPRASDGLRFRTEGVVQAATTVYQGLERIHGIEIRDPTLDRRVIDFCLAIPERQYRAPGISRWLARRLLDSRVPAEVAWERRRGVQAADWHRRLVLARPDAEATLDRMRGSASVRELVDVERLATMLAALPAEPTASRADLMRYGNAMPRGLAMGAFILWAEGRNDP